MKNALNPDGIFGTGLRKLTSKHRRQRDLPSPPQEEDSYGKLFPKPEERQLPEIPPDIMAVEVEVKQYMPPDVENRALPSTFFPATEISPQEKPAVTLMPLNLNYKEANKSLGRTSFQSSLLSTEEELRYTLKSQTRGASTESEDDRPKDEEVACEKVDQVDDSNLAAEEVVQTGKLDEIENVNADSTSKGKEPGLDISRDFLPSLSAPENEEADSLMSISGVNSVAGTFHSRNDEPSVYEGRFEADLEADVLAVMDSTDLKTKSSHEQPAVEMKSTFLVTEASEENLTTTIQKAPADIMETVLSDVEAVPGEEIPKKVESLVDDPVGDKSDCESVADTVLSAVDKKRNPVNLKQPEEAPKTTKVTADSTERAFNWDAERDFSKTDMINRTGTRVVIPSRKASRAIIDKIEAIRASEEQKKKAEKLPLKVLKSSLAKSRQATTAITSRKRVKFEEDKSLAKSKRGVDGLPFSEKHELSKCSEKHEDSEAVHSLGIKAESTRAFPGLFPERNSSKDANMKIEVEKTEIKVKSMDSMDKVKSVPEKTEELLQITVKSSEQNITPQKEVHDTDTKPKEQEVSGEPRDKIAREIAISIENMSPKLDIPIRANEQVPVHSRENKRLQLAIPTSENVLWELSHQEVERGPSSKTIKVLQKSMEESSDDKCSKVAVKGLPNGWDWGISHKDVDRPPSPEAGSQKSPGIAPTRNRVKYLNLDGASRSLPRLLSRKREEKDSSATARNPKIEETPKEAPSVPTRTKAKIPPRQSSRKISDILGDR